MVNLRLIYKIIGSLLFLEGGFMLTCVIMALSYHEDDLIAFLLSMFLTIAAGLVLKYLGRESDNRLSRRDSYLVVTLAWVVFSLFGMMPFYIGGFITDFTDAYFETISGFTTTGATILDDVEHLPHSILFWRTMTQWIGGLGIVFFTIAILPSMVGGSVRIFAAEATGPIKTKMHPRLTTTAKWIWTIYFGLTIACLFSYYAAGMDWFDSANYAMTTLATGGFAPHNDSTSFFHSAAVDYITVLFMFLSGINFMALYSAVFKLRIKSLFNSEFKLYVSIVLGSTLFIIYMLVTRNDYTFAEALRSSLFQVVSFITTTGLFNDDAAAWPRVTWIVLGGLMFIGASAGSTSGGFKCIRGVMLLKVLRNEFRHILHPNAVLPVKVNGQAVPHSRITSLLAFFTLNIVMIIIATTIMIAAGVDNTNAISIALSCLSNVGPTLGTEIGPVMSWSALPDIIKWTCSLLMLMGRLEIISVLVLFTRAFWKDN